MQAMRDSQDKRIVLLSLADTNFSSSEDDSCDLTPREVKSRKLSSYPLDTAHDFLCQALRKEAKAARSAAEAAQAELEDWRSRAFSLQNALERTKQSGRSGKQVDPQRGTQAGERLALRESRAKVSSLNRQLVESRSTAADQANALTLALKVSPLLGRLITLFQSAFRKRRHHSSVTYKVCTYSMKSREAADLKERLSKAEIDVEETHLTCTHLHEEVASLQGNCSEAQESNARLTAEQQDLRAQVKEAQEELTKQKLHFQLIIQATRQATALAEKAQHKAAVLEARLEEMQGGRSKPGFKATELSVRLEMARRAATAGHITTDELRKQLETRQREYDELQASHQALLLELEANRRRSGQCQQGRAAAQQLVQSDPEAKWPKASPEGRRRRRALCTAPAEAKLLSKLQGLRKDEASKTSGQQTEAGAGHVHATLRSLRTRQDRLRDMLLTLQLDS